MRKSIVGTLIAMAISDLTGSYGTVGTSRSNSGLAIASPRSGGSRASFRPKPAFLAPASYYGATHRLFKNKLPPQFRAESALNLSKDKLEGTITLPLDMGWFNVLEDDELRHQVKKVTGMESFPQVFVKGNFLGGLAELEALLKDGQIFRKSAPLQ